ncbi:MAG: AmmeMemoRadiSam system protein A [Acidiferrobacterales bacterium]
MARTSSSRPDQGLSSQDRGTLLQLARASIETGLRGGKLQVDPAGHSSSLQRQGASFVTVKISDELRGCIGSIEPRRVLVIDVVRNAYSAAFHDPRFPALTEEEYLQLDVHISVLSRPEPMMFSSEADLIQQLRPGTDGLILEEGTCRATYLPVVWASLPDPHEFLEQLKRKAGLPPSHWSENIKVRRYTTESIP